MIALAALFARAADPDTQEQEGGAHARSRSAGERCAAAAAVLVESFEVPLVTVATDHPLVFTQRATLK